MRFPPIFSYVIFFLIDTLALTLYLTIFLSPLAPVVDTMGTVLYIVIHLIKYGTKKTRERLFSLKNKKTIWKKALKIFGGSLIPYIHVWAIYDDYKQDIKDAKAKKIEINKVEVETKKEKASLLKKAAVVGAAIATDGASLAVEGSAAKVAASSAERGALRVASRNIGREVEDPWIVRTKKPSLNREGKQTILESLGERTGLNRSDYEEELPDFSRYGTYQEYLEEKKKKEEEEKKEKMLANEKRRIQGIKGDVDLHQQMFEDSRRLFGREANQTKMYQEKLKESKEKEEKVEDE